jgi:nicotinamidase-related amidase
VTHSLPRLRIENSVVIAIDIQTRLLVKIPRAEPLVRNAGFLLDAAGLLDVPMRATEQYPKGLGGTHPDILKRLPGVSEKTSFSCCGAGTFLEELQMLQRPNVVLVGMETHVCIQQTALDLIEAGIHVFLPVDALAARGETDHDTALRRMEKAGAVSTTVEAVAFEWMRDSTHPQFKAVSKMVVERSA